MSLGRRLALSLFRCNDDEVFAELARAVARGVAVMRQILRRPCPARGQVMHMSVEG